VTTRPDHKIARPRYEKRRIEPFTQEEIAGAVEGVRVHAHNYFLGTGTRFTTRRPTAKRDTAMILLLLDTGIRASECARLTIGDVNLETGEVNIEPFGTGQKTKARKVYIGKGTRRAIFRYLAHRDYDDYDYLFATKEDRPMDRNTIRHMLVDLGEKAGVRTSTHIASGHTFAIQFLRNGGDVFNLQNLLGHRSLEMVQNYLRLVDMDSAPSTGKPPLSTDGVLVSDAGNHFDIPSRIKY